MDRKLFKELANKVFFFCLPSSKSRIKYIKKHKIFSEIGDNFFFQPRKLPSDPKFIRFHNNVSVAADVTFYNHDVIYLMHRNIDPSMNYEHMGCIEIMDNCFIGGHSIILPDIKIGPNAIVAAGSVVTKDVPEGTIVGGNPAKVIGRFSDLYDKRKIEIASTPVHYGRLTKERADYEWSLFRKKHN